ncbi:MAG: transcriptional regulator LeuO [Vibrio sp.]
MTSLTNPTDKALKVKSESRLRGVDLNLLTVFDAVMQEQNITRAAQYLGMSQPAVSNAVARLKVMFNDELFIRHGRGIQPTQRARQLFGPVRQSLQLVLNELPGSVFDPQTSTRTFKLALCSPSDLRFAPAILRGIHQVAPHIQLQITADADNQLADKLKYQEVDFVIDYMNFDGTGFCSTEIFNDDLVVVSSATHPRLKSSISQAEFIQEQHAAMTQIEGVRTFYDYISEDLDCNCAYQGASLSNILYVVSQSDMITVVPRWLLEGMPNPEQFNVYEYPYAEKSVSGFLSWHDSSEKDKGHIWMRDQLMMICGETLAAAYK